jgi:putative ABC transport system permease protein
MAIAFINLIFVTSLFNGIVEGSNDQIINTYVGNIMISPVEGQDFLEHADATVATVLRTNGVAGASAETTVPATLKYKSIMTNRQILAIDPDMEKTVTNVSKKMIEGSYLDQADTDGIIIGRQIAGGPDVEQNATSFKGAHAGEPVILTLNGASKEFIIRGIFDTKFINADSRAFITERAFELLNPASTDKVTNIIIRINKKGEERSIINILNIKVAGTFSTWEDATGLIKSITKSFLSINVLMTFVGILIAAATIIIIIYIDITNKKRQIGILRAIGIKVYLIRATYVIQTAVYSVAGVALGTALFFGAIVPYFNIHPFSLPICDATLRVNVADFIFRAEAVMIVALLSGLLPAYIVTRMKMLNAILGK